jgi:multidrug resistance efflux pump
MNTLPRSRALLSLSALALLAAACGGPPGGAGATPTPDATREARPEATVDRTVDTVVTADGEIVLPVPPQALSFPSGGTLLDLSLQPGEPVAAGQVLARMDLLPFDIAVADAEAALASARQAQDELTKGASASDRASAQAEVAAAESALAKLESGAGIETARLEVERAKNQLWGIQAERDSYCGAAEREMATQAACDAAQANVQAGEQGVRIAEQSLATARASQAEDARSARARLAAARAALGRLSEGARPAQLEAARARIAQAELALTQARTERERAVLVAPFDGTVTAVHAAEGVRVAPGSPVVTVAQVAPLRFATTNLSERNVGDVREGDGATVTLTAYPDQPLPATVQRIAAEAGRTEGGATVFTVYLDVEAGEIPLRAGMTGRVEIEVGDG